MALSVETCVDEKTFYEKLELLKENSKSKITVDIDQLFNDNVKNYFRKCRRRSRRRRTRNRSSTFKARHQHYKMKRLGFKEQQDYYKGQQDISTKK